ncbi:WD40 repeat domain-containing protein [Streptomyces sp. CBMA152]|uniref:WD40 repeat domain-containing protein n=1 Tax=Streptomyces sp. CBMA152 TaxID=1896312 RepID=UPI001660B8A3|nr:WD40 repeat domain-containing protein [Streptomyces sp. CBMA152]MBD0742752.1 hypothetical protein [Streptomyces sp. CBMA152]
MGRREKPIEPTDGPVQRLAQELRRLRQEAGSPTYRAMERGAGYSAAALSRAAAGEKLPSLPVVLAYVQACGADIAGWEERWREASRAEAAEPYADDEDAVPPFRGLARYEPDDADRFFGRDGLTDALTRMACGHRVSAVLGPSGSGKSSLLRAGLIPRLRALGAPHVPPAAIRVLTPGPHPVRDHHALFVPDPAAGDTWLIVDQFEEVFTLCHDPAERGEFIELLMSARTHDSRLRMVLGVRADFYSHCLEHPDLASVVGEASLPVRPLTPTELREVIVKSAAAHGLMVERALTARVLEEAAAEPGSLPLLSHALLETWRRRRGRTLSLEGYELAGGLHGAIAQSAEAAYSRLPDEQAQVARQILLRLITPGEGTPDTRRPTDREEVDAVHPAQVAPVLEHLARARLIALDGQAVDLTHEALITAWPRLRRWIDQDRERLRAHRQLAEASRDWQDLGRDSGALLRGTRLDQAESAFDTPARRGELTALEDALLTASRRARRRARRTRRAVAATLSVLVVLALVATTVAWQQGRARDEQSRQTAARAAAALAESMHQSDPQAAMRLSLAAWRIAPVPEARAAVLAAASRPDQDTDNEPQPDPDAPHFLDRFGRTLTTRADGGVVQRNVDGHRTLSADPVDADPMDASPDGKTVLLKSRDGIRLWHHGLTEHAEETFPGSVLLVGRFQADGRALVLTDSYDVPTIQVWDVTRRRLLFKDAPGHPPTAPHTAVSDDERYLAMCPAGGTLEVWDMAAKRTLPVPSSVGSFARCPAADAFHRMRFTHGSQSLAVMTTEGMVSWNITTGHEEDRVSQRGISDAELSEDGKLLAAATADEILIWRTTAPSTPVFRYRLENEQARTLRLDTERGLLRYLGGRSKVAVRSLDIRPVARSSDDTASVDWALFSPDAKVFATRVRHGSRLTFELRDATTGKSIAHLPAKTCPATDTDRCGARMTFSADGRTLAYGTFRWEKPNPNQQITLYDVVGHRTKAVVDLTPTGRPLGETSDIALTPSGKALLVIRSTNGRRSLERWDPEDGSMSVVGEDPGKSFQLPPTDRQAITEGGYVTDLKTGRTTVHAHAEDLRIGVATSAHGLTAAGSMYPAIAVWDGDERWETDPLALAERDVQRLADQPVLVTALALSPDVRTLATAGSDGSLQLWDVRSHRPLGAPLPTGGDPVYSLAFSADSGTLYAAGLRAPWHAYPSAPQTLAQHLCDRLRGGFDRAQWKQLIPEAPYRNIC